MLQSINKRVLARHWELVAEKIQSRAVDYATRQSFCSNAGSDPGVTGPLPPNGNIFYRKQMR